MGKEIERKFLVLPEKWRVVRSQAVANRISQGFLSSVKERVVRVRVVGGGGKLTIKGKTKGVSRTEFEYEIPLEEAQQLLSEMCERPIIEKIRYQIEHDGLVWEVDEFEGENQGLMVAEVELEDESQSFSRPVWIGQEVSDDSRYYNANLIKNPFSQWGSLS